LDTINQTSDSLSLWFLKLDYNMNRIDSLEINNPNFTTQVIWSGQRTSDDNLIFMAGGNKNNNDQKLIGMLLDTNFNMIWQTEMGNSLGGHGYFVDEFNDGSFLFSGIQKDPATFKWQSYLFKLDANGNTVWDMTYGAPHNNQGGGPVAVLPNDEFILTNNIWNGTQYPDILLTWFTEDSDSIRSKQYYHGNETEYINAKPLILDDGSIVIAGGYYDSTVTNSPNGQPVGWIIKTDPMGDVIWETDLNYFADSNGLQFGSNNAIYSIEQTADGGFIACGNLQKYTLTGQDTFILVARLDSNGCILSQCANYTGVAEYVAEDIEISCKIFPNPSNGVFNFSTIAESFYTIELFDLTGRTISTNLFTKDISIDLSGESKGLYLYIINNANGLGIKKGKIILQ